VTTSHKIPFICTVTRCPFNDNKTCEYPTGPKKAEWAIKAGFVCPLWIEEIIEEEEDETDN